MTLKKKRIEWKAIYEAWKESGQSVAEWCRNHEIKVHQMYYWVKEFEQNNRDAELSDEPKWLTVQVDKESMDSIEKDFISLHAGAITVEVRPGVDICLLYDVVHVLQNQCLKEIYMIVFI